MRRLFLSVVSVVLLTSLAVNGCGGDDDNGRLPDAPPPPIDTPPPDMPMPLAPVTLKITKNGAAMKDIVVYFQSTDAGPATRTTTDQTGTASATIAAGGYVTAIDPFVTPPPPVVFGAFGVPELRTFAGVKPGDHLLLTQNDATPITFTLNAPAVEGANDYQVFTSCGTSSIAPGGGSGGSNGPDPGGSVTLYDCNGTADIAILASAPNDGPEIPISALYHPNQALSPNGTVTLTDNYEALVNRTFTYMNIPDQSSVQVSHTLVGARGRFGEFFLSGVGDSGTIQEPAIPATGSIVDTALQRQGRHHVIDWGNVVTAYTLDMNNLLLPDLTTFPGYNSTNRRASWMEETTGAAPDVTLAGIRVSRSDGETQRNWHWRIAGPYAPGEIRFPVLPTDVFDFNPGANEADVSELVIAKLPGGYDAVRARVHDVAELGRLTAFVAGATGRVVVVELSFLAERRRR